MARQNRYNTEQLAEFANEIRFYSRRFEYLEDVFKPSGDNPMLQIALIGASIFLDLVMQTSPVDTGTLRDAHIISEGRLIGWDTGVQAEVDVTIDPNPNIINPKYGGFPGEYGPKYHRERRAWFEEAAHMMDPLFDDVVDEQFDIFLTGVGWYG